jgi:ABC-type lipoprotein export system ATPase subunit
MLKTIEIEQFTVFKDACKLQFSEGLNVVIGDNSTGKSHLLKLGYVFSAVSHELHKNSASSTLPLTKETKEHLVSKKLLNVFQPEQLGRLVTRKQGVNTATLKLTFKGVKSKKVSSVFDVSFSTKTRKFSNEGKNRLILPTEFLSAPSVFIPAKEILSVFGGFQAALEGRELGFDETYLDLAKSLAPYVLKGRKEERVKPLYDPIEKLLKGTIFQENGRFYLSSTTKGMGRIEAPLMAEGFRKLAMLAYLVKNGTLTQQSTLYWDEPEANLNPALQQTLAGILAALANEGIQVVIATHSLFLLRELEILQQNQEFKKKPAFFVLSREVVLGKDEEGPVTVAQSDHFNDLEPIVSLNADIEQTERYLRIE